MFLLKVAALWLRFYQYMYHLILEKSKFCSSLCTT
jgi:hypothetical protein